MFKVNDLITYSSFASHKKEIGQITEIYNIEDSIFDKDKGKKVYKIKNISNGDIDIIPTGYIQEAYNKYYDRRIENEYRVFSTEVNEDF